MTSPHPDFGPELRQLAQSILDRLDPAVRAAVAAAGEAMRGPGRCQQVWCPVCAAAALVNGEQHPLLGLISEHSVTWLTVIRTMVADPDGSGEAPPVDDEAVPAADDTPPTTQNGRYHHIPIVVEPTGEASASGVEPAPDTVTADP